MTTTKYKRSVPAHRRNKAHRLLEWLKTASKYLEATLKVLKLASLIWNFLHTHHASDHFSVVWAALSKTI